MRRLDYVKGIKSNFRILNITDGGSLASLASKGNLKHVEELYNPKNYFSEVHIIAFEKKDLDVKLSNPTLIVHYVNPRLLRSRICFFLNFLYLIYQLLKIVRKNNISLIRSRGVYLAGLLSVIIGKLTRLPIVVSLGGDYRLEQDLRKKHHILNNRFLSFKVEEFVLKKADLIFCINEFIRKYVLRLGANTAKTRYIPIRIDVNQFAPRKDKKELRKKLGWGDEPIVLFCGRFELDKQVDLLFKSIPEILREEPSTRFVFLGDGSLKDKLIEYAKKHHFLDSVTLQGFVQSEKVAEFLAASDVVWIPMSGFVVYEAAASGKPVVAFDVDWHSEFIKNEESGLLVENRNSDKLADAVIKLLKNPELAEKLGMNARKKIMKDFNPDELAAKEIEAYKEILKGRWSR